MKTSVTWAELLIVAMLSASGMGLWLAAEWVVDATIKLPEPQEVDFHVAYHVADLYRDCSMEEATLKATLNLATDQQLESERLRAQMQILEQSHPGIEKQSPRGDITLDAAIKSYREAKAQREVAVLFEQRLRRSLSELKARLSAREASLSVAKQKAADALKAATISRTRKRTILSAFWAIVGVVPFLFVAWVLLRGRAGKALGLRHRSVLVAVTAILFALFSYNALGSHFVVFGCFLLLIGTGILLHYVSSSNSGGATN